MHKGSFALHTCRLQLEDIKQMFTAILKNEGNQAIHPLPNISRGRGGGVNPQFL